MNVGVTNYIELIPCCARGLASYYLILCVGLKSASCFSESLGMLNEQRLKWACR